MLDFLKKSHETTREEKPSLAYIYCMNIHMYNLAPECRQNLWKRKEVNKNSISVPNKNENDLGDSANITSRNK